MTLVKFLLGLLENYFLTLFVITQNFLHFFLRKSLSQSLNLLLFSAL